MNMQIRATSPAKGIILSCVTLCAAACLFLNIIPKTAGNLIMLTFCLVLVIPGTIYHLLHAAYLTPEGIEYRRLGRVLRLLPWNQVAQVRLIHDFRLSARSSGISRIVITPNGCDLYDSRKWSGLQYLLIFRHRVIWIDHTKNNRHFIEQHCEKSSILWENI